MLNCKYACKKSEIEEIGFVKKVSIINDCIMYGNIILLITDDDLSKYDNAILYIQYTGAYYGTGDYILKADMTNFEKEILYRWK